MPISPGGMRLVETLVCFHCQQEAVDSPFAISFHSAIEDVALRLCRSCQSLRQGGQLPTELLLHQWVYAQGGRSDAGSPLADLHVRLACLGCGEALAALAPAGVGDSLPVFASSRRLPDGSLAVACPKCQRTNVLEGRGGQLIAVCLW